MNAPLVTVAKNGAYWLARWRDPDTRKRKGRTIGPVAEMSKLAARLEANKIALQLALDPAFFDPDHLTLRAWCDLFLQVRTDLALGSRKELTDTAARLCEVLGAGALLNQIDTDDAERFRLAMERRTVGKGENAKPLALATVRKHIRNAKTIFAKALRARPPKIQYNPFELEDSGVPEAERDWAEVDDKATTRLLDAAPDAQWRLAIGLARYAGLRRGEVFRLVLADVDWDGRLLTVALPDGVQENSTKKRRRTVPIEPRLWTLLLEAREAMTEGEDRFITFQEEGSGDRLWHIAKRAGLDPWPKPFHTLRKCRETEWMAEHPVLTVAQWMGHDPKVAAKHYTRPTQASVEAVTGYRHEVIHNGKGNLSSI